VGGPGLAFETWPTHLTMTGRRTGYGSTASAQFALSSARSPFFELSNDLLGGSRFPQAGKYSCRAVQVSVQVHVSHGVDRQGIRVRVPGARSTRLRC
jgi:hypothetical protein